MNKKEIPVYLFTGFLEAGKTTFIVQTLGDEEFNDGTQNILVIACEQGMEEYELEGPDFGNVFVEYIEDKSQLNAVNLNYLVKKNDADSVLLEYNGTWMMGELFQAMPDNWIIYQEFMFADSNTFVNYNANMRQLTFDKLNTCDCVVFNRYSDKIDQMELHKIVRAVSRRCDIMYERPDGYAFPDTIEDPLPFDVNAPVIEIEDRDYALWYRDLDENMASYDGKTVKFKCVTANSDRLPAGIIVVGRPVMTCCADDIQNAGLAGEFNGPKPPQRKWFIVTAKIAIKKSVAYNDKKGPVLIVQNMQGCEAPDEPVATFY